MHVYCTPIMYRTVGVGDNENVVRNYSYYYYYHFSAYYILLFYIFAKLFECVEYCGK